MKLLSLFGVVSLISLSDSADICSNTEPWWTTQGGNILLNGEHVYHLKGTSWFGMETETNAPHGLWSLSIRHFVDFLEANLFNAVRLPFSVANVLNNPSNTNVDCGQNPGVCQMDYLDLMGEIIDKLGERGILVMLDQHRLSGNGISSLWYNNEFPENRILESWDILMNRFGRKWNVFALDLKNEPHNEASWGMGRTDTDWNKAAERIIQYIASTYAEYQGLFFVEGVQEHANTTTPNQYSHWWGGNMEGVRTNPISTGDPYLDDRVVYSPHVYGPDVFVQDYFLAGNFPQNMPPIWDLHFGFVEELTGHPIVVGEWGGHYLPGHSDREWQNRLGLYMKEKCMSDNFYWCLNPNSGDTGGLLKDNWRDGNEDKLALLRSLQPDPSWLSKMPTGQFCLRPGSFANPQCASGVVTPPTQPTPPPIVTTTRQASTTTRRITTPQATTTPRATTTPQTTNPTTTRRATTTSNSPPGPPSSQALDVTVRMRNEWTEGNPATGKHYINVYLELRNLGSQSICGGSVLQMSPPDAKIRSKWNLVGSTAFMALPSWFNLPPGGANYDTGMIIQATELPSFSVQSIVFC